MAKLTSPPVHTPQEAQLDTSSAPVSEGVQNGFTNAQPSSGYVQARAGAVQPGTLEETDYQTYTREEHSNGASAPVRLSVQTSPCVSHIHWHHGAVGRLEKERLLQQRGCLLWFTGLSGSGKSTVACLVEQMLLAQGKLTKVIDGDNLRHGLNNGLGFSAEDREENIRRAGEVGKLMVETGIIAIASLISPYARDRQKIRSRLAPGDFIEVFMDTPLSTCEARDCKGLYKKARAGLIKGFTGISDPYECPEQPELVLQDKGPDGQLLSAQDLAETVIGYLQQTGRLAHPPTQLHQNGRHLQQQLQFMGHLATCCNGDGI
ncbi:hypothetical protein WJX74_009096 [Apatococcus lobatus]|uniref:Adenylyl-sulfate kinase n=1 Tax=Apatococcus lobatus TaxID=904363 RepID=A0AAW1Q8X4_9CHLO